jgi:hypothetical protein
MYLLKKYLTYLFFLLIRKKIAPQYFSQKKPFLKQKQLFLLLFNDLLKNPYHNYHTQYEPNAHTYA